MTELLPCPFCGSEPEWNVGKTGLNQQEDWHYIACSECEAMGPCRSNQKEGLIIDWNTRAQSRGDAVEVVTEGEFLKELQKCVMQKQTTAYFLRERFPNGVKIVSGE